MTADPTQNTSWPSLEGFEQVKSHVPGVIVFAPKSQSREEDQAKRYTCPNCGAVTSYDVVSGGIAGIILLLSLPGFLLTAIFPPAGIIAALLAVLGFGTGIGALYPAIWLAQWNRTHQTPRITERDK